MACLLVDDEFFSARYRRDCCTYRSELFAPVWPIMLGKRRIEFDHEFGGVAQPKRSARET